MTDFEMKPEGASLAKHRIFGFCTKTLVSQLCCFKFSGDLTCRCIGHSFWGWERVLCSYNNIGHWATTGN